MRICEILLCITIFTQKQCPPCPKISIWKNTAWRGDAALVQQLYDAGASLDVKGTSRGEGPYSPIEWAERKVSLLDGALFQPFSFYLFWAYTARNTTTGCEKIKDVHNF